MRLIDADALKELLIDTLESIKKNPKMDGQEAHIIAACHMLTEMIDDASTVSTARNGWISVKDRLPEYPGHYLVCTSINYWHGGCMDINENHKHYPNGTPVGYDGTTMSVLDCYYDVTGHWNRVCDSHVAHWMPIPEPPETLIKEE